MDIQIMMRRVTNGADYGKLQKWTSMEVQGKCKKCPRRIDISDTDAMDRNMQFMHSDLYALLSFCQMKCFRFL